MRSLMQYGLAAGAAACLALAGCGGGDSVVAADTVTGKFVDATVVGLGYKCGASATLSGSTDANGQFTCKAGESVAFYVGGIRLGSVASAQAVVTPLDLVGAGATPNDAKVINIVRFLMSISSTAATSGILTIDPAVANAAAGSSIDFTQAIPSNLDSMINTLKPAGATLATAQQATTHMQNSVFGLFAGSFAGSYSGTTSGTWTLTINSQGVVSGTATDSSNATAAIAGSMATTMGTGSTYSFSGTGGTAAWAGTLNMNTRVFSGTWDGGTFTGVATTAAPAAPAATPAATPASAPGAAGSNTLIVSGVTPASGNGNFGLPTTAETAAGGTSTDKRVEFTDATPATRTLRLYFAPGTGTLTVIQYNSPAGNFGCFVGDPVAPCDSAKITFSASGKSILLDRAEFRSGTAVSGVLEGYLTW